MSAEKKSKNKTVKKSGSTGGTKKGQSQTKHTGSGSNNTAFFILIIIILVTIIVLMLNRSYDKGKLKFPDFSKFIPAADESKEKKAEPQKDKTSDKTKSEMKQETGKEEAVKESESKDEVKEKEKPASETRKEVSVYLLKLDEKTERIYLSPVKRVVTEKDILGTTLENLIKGPTQNEKNRGYITAVPQGLKIRSIAINGKTAEIDFNSSIEEGAAGDILLKRVQQIVYTSTQFDSVNSIIIKINGQKRKSMGSDGFSISGPLKR